mgnify:FL=1
MPFAAAKTQMAMRMFNAPPTLSKNDVNGRVPMSLEQNNANKTANLNASTVHSVGMTKYKRYAIPSAPKAVFNTLAAPSTVRKHSLSIFPAIGMSRAAVKRMPRTAALSVPAAVRMHTAWMPPNTANSRNSG